MKHSFVRLVMEFLLTSTICMVVSSQKGDYYETRTYPIQKLAEMPVIAPTSTTRSIA